MENREMIRENVKDMVYRELDAITNEGQLTMECVHVLYELWDILKDIEEVAEKETMIEEGYSSRGRGMSRYYDGGGSSYMSGGSYNSNGSSYRSNGGGRTRNNGYSRDDGRQEMMNELEKLMNETRDEHVKDSIRKMLNNDMR